MVCFEFCFVFKFSFRNLVIRMVKVSYENLEKTAFLFLCIEFRTFIVSLVRNKWNIVKISDVWNLYLWKVRHAKTCATVIHELELKPRLSKNRQQKTLSIWNLEQKSDTEKTDICLTVTQRRLHSQVWQVRKHIVEILQFSTTQILREITFGECNFAISSALNFCFG